MQDGAEFAAFGLGDRSFQSRRLSLGDILLSNSADQIERLQGASTERDRVSAEAVLSEVGEHKRRHAVEPFNLLYSFAKVLFPVELDIERVVGFKQVVQDSLESFCGDRGVGQDGQDLSQLGDCGDANFIPVEVRLLQSRKRLVGLIVSCRFQGASIKKVLQQNSVARRRHRLVVLLEDAVCLGENRCAVVMAHAMLALWCGMDGSGLVQAVGLDPGGVQVASGFA